MSVPYQKPPNTSLHSSASRRMMSSQLTTIKTPSSTKPSTISLNLRPYFLSLISLSTNTYPHAGGWSQRGPPISAASLTVFCFAGTFLNL
ncbi:putative prion, copper binding octapeptide [Helianthus annuus]|nr:putative prion, copper binding octapeptide [Helianthus annuus]